MHTSIDMLLLFLRHSIYHWECCFSAVNAKTFIVDTWEPMLHVIPKLVSCCLYTFKTSTISLLSNVLNYDDVLDYMVIVMIVMSNQVRNRHKTNDK